MPVTNLRFNITSDWDGGGVRAAASALNGVGRSVERVNRRMGRGLAGMGLLAKAALLLAPALFTLGKAALAGLGGLTTMAAASLLAAAPFIALAITAARNAEKMGEAGKAYEKATDRVGNAWMGLARRTASLTLGPMTDVLDGLATAIPKLEPLVRRIAPVFADMGKSIRGWLEGPGFERFISNLMDFGVPAFRNLVAAGRDFLATVGIGFRAFLPLALDMSEAIRRGAANMRDWAAGGGFDRFLDKVRQEWPTVRGFMSELGTSLGRIGGVLDDLGPGQLSGLTSVLDKFNDVDVDGWRSFLLTLAGLRVGGGLLSLLGGLANLRAGGLQIAGAGALAGAAAALSAAGGILNGAAAALSAAAAALSAAGAAAGIGGALGGILGGLGARLAGGSATFTVNIEPSDADDVLQRIADRIAELDGRTATMTVTLNAGAFTTVAQTVLSAWAAVRAAASFPAVFRAMAIPGNVPAVAAMLIAAWVRVRAAAAVPAIFRAMAIPGNVIGVAASLVAAWSRVRAAAAATVTFRATANTSSVVSNAARAVAAWRRVLSMPRSWSAVATVNAGAAVAGANAARAAWSSVLAMPRSVTFTVNIVTKKTGNSEGGPPIPVPHFAHGGSGKVFGPGGPRSDRIPAMLSSGEWVIRAAAVKALGSDFLAWVNSAGSGSGPRGGGGGGPMPAMAGMGSGGDTHVHFHGSVYAKSDMDFEEMLAGAAQELSRKGRWP